MERVRVEELLQDEAWSVRAGAVVALGQVLHVRPGTALDLVDMASDEDPRVRAAALAALASSEPVSGDGGFPLAPGTAPDCLSFLLLLAQPTRGVPPLAEPERVAERALACLAALNAAPPLELATAMAVLDAAAAQMATPAEAQPPAVAAALAVACARFGARHTPSVAAIARLAGGRDNAARRLAAAGAYSVDPASFWSPPPLPPLPAAPPPSRPVPLMAAVCAMLSDSERTHRGRRQRHMRAAIAAAAASPPLLRDARVAAQLPRGAAPPAAVEVGVSVASVGEGEVGVAVRLRAAGAAVEGPWRAHVAVMARGGPQAGQVLGSAAVALHARPPEGGAAHLALYPPPGAMSLLCDDCGASAGLWALGCEAEEEAARRRALPRPPPRTQDPLWELPPRARALVQAAAPVRVAERAVTVRLRAGATRPDAIEVRCQARHASGHEGVAEPAVARFLA